LRTKVLVARDFFRRLSCGSCLDGCLIPVFFPSSFTDDFDSAEKNPYFYLWIFASIVSSCYSYTWDVRMDWGKLAD
jgi:hypothetical protein